MQAQGGPGSIVLMSSGAGRFPHPHLWAYGVSKAGICFLAETAAEELGPLGIRVNAVAPGHHRRRADGVHHRRAGRCSTTTSRRCPWAGSARSRTWRRPCATSSGPESSFVTGETLGVDGGHHLRRGADYSLLFGG